MPETEIHATCLLSSLQMGYIHGKGLGKNQQGISTPVEAAKRRGKGAIGYYGTERTERSLKDFPIKPDADEQEDEAFRQELHQWKRTETDVSFSADM